MGAVRHRFTVDEYRKMGEAGIFHEDDRVELIDGEVVEMAALGAKHVESVYRLNRLLSRWTFVEEADDGEEGSMLFVSVQNPLTLAIDDEPRPDLVVVQRRGGSSGVPVPEEVLLVVEVADTSLRYDRDVKLPMYAAAGISAAWLVDLNADAIEAHSEPGPRGYGRIAHFGRDQKVAATILPGLAFEVAEALPPGR